MYEPRDVKEVCVCVCVGLAICTFLNFWSRHHKRLFCFTHARLKSVMLNKLERSGMKWPDGCGGKAGGRAGGVQTRLVFINSVSYVVVQ